MKVTLSSKVWLLMKVFLCLCGLGWAGFRNLWSKILRLSMKEWLSLKEFWLWDPAMVRKASRVERRATQIGWSFSCEKQGCQMVYFHTKNPDSYMLLEMENAIILIAICNTLSRFGIFYGQLVILSSFGVFSPIRYSVPRQIRQP
jgi:hypothetical protein